MEPEESPPQVQSPEDQQLALGAYIAGSNWNEALALLDKMPDTPENRFTKADILIKLDRMDEAEAILKLLDGVYPQDRLSMKLGLFYFYLKKYQEAKFWLRVAMRYPSTQTDANKTLEEVLAFSPESYSDKDEKVIQLNPIQPKITFKDVIGMDEVKGYMYDNVINPILHRDEYLKVGKKIGTGVILTGPPGCGKTFIGEAVAGESKAFFINVQPSEIVGSYVGVTQKNIATVFLQARMHTPCILFIDEIDNLGTKRGGDQDAHNAVNRQAVTQFLLEMNSMDKVLNNIFVISATNRYWEIDPALRRSKRLGDMNYITLPNDKERKELIQYYIHKAKERSASFQKNEGIEIKVDVNRINRATINYSPSDIDTIIDKSLIPLAKRQDKTLYTKDIIEVIKEYRSSTQNWFDSTYKELRGRPVYNPRSEEKEIIDYEGGKLMPEEIGEYHDLIEDIKKNTDERRKWYNKAIRLSALYIA